MTHVKMAFGSVDVYITQWNNFNPIDAVQKTALNTLKTYYFKKSLKSYTKKKYVTKKKHHGVLCFVFNLKKDLY